MVMQLGVSNELDDMESRHIRLFIDYRVEGVLVIASRSGVLKDYFIELRNSDVPFVILGDGEAIGVDSAMADDETGAYEAVSHLQSKGYSRIAVIGDLWHASLSMRVAGYKRALLEHNLRYNPDYMADCGKLLQVRESVEGLLDLDEPPDAIFACNDATAIEAIHALALMGKRVPDDVAVVGFDNIHLAEEVTPALTTVDLRSADVVDKGLEMLMAKIENHRKCDDSPPPVTPQHLKIKPRLCVRETA
jgi:LacI family transcriptional regulator